MPMRDLMAVMSGQIALANLGDKGASMKGSAKDDNITPREFKDVEFDNCKDLLHSARWQRMPISPPSNWWHLVPEKMVPVVINSLQLDATGTEDQVLAETIRIMHDRRVILELKFFYIGSFDSAKGKGGGVLEMGSSMLQIQEALANFQNLLQQIFPWDTTPGTMWRILVVYKWIGAAFYFDTRRDIVIFWFNSVSRKNANNAENGKPPIDYADQEKLLKKALRKFKVKDEIPTGEDTANHAEPKQNFAGKKQPNNSGGGGGKKKSGNGAGPSGQNKQSNKRQRAQKNGKLACIDYNNKEQCPNEPEGTGCKKEIDGVMKYFEHCCNVFDKRNGVHCLQNHSRLQHGR